MLIETPYGFRGSLLNYDIHPDGQRFVMVKGVGNPDTQIVLVENWFEELERLVPVP